MKNEKIRQQNCFKAYDVRGRVPQELNEDIARRIGQAFAVLFKAKQVVVGHDVRLSSPALHAALADGLNSCGADVLDIGLCGTEEVYYATAELKADGGIMVTASHNPAEYNGMKFVGRESRPISSDTGLGRIREMVLAGGDLAGTARGREKSIDSRSRYIDHIVSYIEPKTLRPLKVVANCGNGCAGPVVDLLEERLPISLVKLQHEPDGSFPNGVPNPLLPENRKQTGDAVVSENADIGIAWDGDFDRCFLFDEQGNFIEGYYLVGLLAGELLHRRGSGWKIIHDPRLVWNTRELVRQKGGIPVMSRTGHAFIKEAMRQEDALYGGEMSGHHYFRDFNYCDSGMIPWLLVWQLMSRTGMPLAETVAERMALYPVSGEINREVADPDAAIARIESHFRGAPCTMDYTDGLSVSCTRFRVNVRKSNTEPVLRLNVESRGDRRLMEEKTAEMVQLLEG